MLRRTLCVLLSIAGLATYANAKSFPGAISTGGMVTADNSLASEAGAQMLRQGGNAADAAVATALVLGVVQPFASGIGGGGFAIVHMAGSKTEPKAYDFREVAPAGASKDMYLDASGGVIPKASTRGPRAAGVPGELRGLELLHRENGKLPWRTVVGPALELARDGFPVGVLLHQRIASKLKLIHARPALAIRFLTPNGQPLPAGVQIRRPKLAEVLQRVADEGADAFYSGTVARELVAAMKRDGGLITAQDLSTYRVKMRPVVHLRWRGRDLFSMPPPSSGGAVLGQVLGVLASADLKAEGHNSSAYLHRLAEALKHGFADRGRLMGDPDFTAIPMDAFLSAKTIERVRKAFNPKATLDRAAYGGNYGLPTDGGTSHFNVIDAEGNAVALTSTVNTSFGSMYIAGETGVLMNNQMDDFVSKPGVPNAFGLVGRAANAIAPGKKPLSSMSPTLVLKDGEIELAVGASGGPTIITGTLQVLINVLAFGMEVRAAVEAPRIHHQWVPELLYVEGELPRDVTDALTARGHVLKPTRRWTSVQAIYRKDGILHGACDPSKLGAPAVAP